MAGTRWSSSITGSTKESNASTYGVGESLDTEDLDVTSGGYFAGIVGMPTGVPFIFGTQAQFDFSTDGTTFSFNANDNLTLAGDTVLFKFDNADGEDVFKIHENGSLGVLNQPEDPAGSYTTGTLAVIDGQLKISEAE